MHNAKCATQHLGRQRRTLHCTPSRHANSWARSRQAPRAWGVCDDILRAGMTARAIPSIDQLVQRPAVQALVARFGHAAVVQALRSAADALRERIRAGGPADEGAIAATIEERAGVLLASNFR